MLKCQKSKAIVHCLSFVMAPTAVCFPLPYQYWLYARAREAQYLV